MQRQRWDPRQIFHATAERSVARQVRYEHHLNRFVLYLGKHVFDNLVCLEGEGNNQLVDLLPL